jgi:4-hydroxybenzoate polyprenyltransferase
LVILSGGFLLGGLLSPDLNGRWFVIQFLNVHLLLFAGATAYNSFWDKDSGPIGGLRHPPKMRPWMWLGSLILQMIGLMLAIPQGSLYVSIYALSMLLFWLYSTPLARWKSHPVKSLVAIGVSTGFNSVLLGYLAAGNTSLSLPVWIAAFGVTCMLLSLYPVSQIYQRDEDLRRGDQTFTIRYGERAVYRFFEIAFFVGLTFVSVAILYLHTWLAIIFGMLGIITGLYVRSRIRELDAQKESYFRVMGIKYGTSLAFTLFLIAGIILKHIEIDGISSVANLLLE